MKFSVELASNCDPADIPEHARIIEECGFYRIWVRDMIIVPWELWTALSTVVLSTNRIRVGMDVANPYTRSPVVMAHAAVTLDRISKGRLDLGFGGGIPGLLKKMGIEKKEEALGECVHIVRALLSGNTVSFQGKTFQINDIQLPALPYSKNVPIFIAAMDEKNFHLAQRLSDGVLSISANEKYLEKALDMVKNEAKAIPLATWLPFSRSEEKLTSYVRMISPQLPDGFWEMAETHREGLGNDELIDIFGICGEEDLEQKVEKLAGLGVSEMIFECSALDELAILASKLKKHF